MSISFMAIDENGRLKPFVLQADVSTDLMRLPEEHSRYFDLSGQFETVPLAKLVSSRARPHGIANANKRLMAAAAGEILKRKPISISAIGGGLFKVDDGNSTLINALFSGWQCIPCRHSHSES